MSTDAIVVLREDHKQVMALFRKFEGAGENALAQKGAIVKQIIELLTIHTYIESEVMYPQVDFRSSAAPATGSTHAAGSTSCRAGCTITRTCSTSCCRSTLKTVRSVPSILTMSSQGVLSPEPRRRRDSFLTAPPVAQRARERTDAGSRATEIRSWVKLVLRSSNSWSLSGRGQLLVLVR